MSNNILPLGGIIFAIFCCSKWGWGWKNFIAEADEGKGIKFPVKLRLWCMYGIPALAVIIFIMGYAPMVTTWLGLGQAAKRSTQRGRHAASGFPFCGLNTRLCCRERST